LRHTDAARLGKRFQTSGYIYAVTEEVAAIDRHVSLSYADAEGDMKIGRQIGIERLGSPQYFDGARNGIDRARKLNKNAVSDQLDNPSAKSHDVRPDDLSLDGLEPVQGTWFVSSYETAVPRDIRHEDCSQSAF
jgi:hypothetical protein